MKIVIRPLSEPGREIDITRALTAVVAKELWSSGGGNEVVNWLEAEVHLARLLRGPEAVADVGDGGTRIRSDRRAATAPAPVRRIRVRAGARVSRTEHEPGTARLCA